MVLGKMVAIFDLDSGRNSAPREGQKMPCHVKHRSRGYPLAKTTALRLTRAPV